MLFCMHQSSALIQLQYPQESRKLTLTVEYVPQLVRASSWQSQDTDEILSYNA